MISLNRLGLVWDEVTLRTTKGTYRKAAALTIQRGNSAALLFIFTDKTRYQTDFYVI
jgi:hypothetical protein